ncbi:MAG: DUF3482 domain-containing protein [Planctomycetota bacterium]|jgi:GTPase SAR1 family protein
MNHGLPTFVVVGHVNKGKSSVVATLLEDPSIPIDLIPGTTTEAAAYNFRIDGKAVFRLIDTPGFQEAAAALDWLEQYSQGVGDRQATIRAFVQTFEGGTRFHDEVELLRPLLEPGPVGLLYVVDASRPYRATHEAEMEILRWCGRPGLALMNRIGTEDCAEQWRPVLQQFFSVVRSFHAHQADPEERLRLLATFGELHEDCAGPLQAAVESLKAVAARRDLQKRESIATYLVAAWSHVETASSHADASDRVQQELSDRLAHRYERHLRNLENGCRRSVEAIYGFSTLEALDRPFDITPEDLFDHSTWRLFGLSQTQLTARAAAAGGVTGGVLDLFTGGLSLGVGVALGSAVGAAGAWFGSRRVAQHWTPKHERLAKLFPGEYGHVRAFGPIAKDAFAYILLDRALLHGLAVQHRAHARQGPLDLQATDGQRARDMSAEQRSEIDRILALCQKAGREGLVPGPEVVDRLARCLGMA